MKLLTTAAMVDNCAEKFDKCPLNRGPLFRGCLSIEVNGRTVGTFRIVRYIVGVRC